MGITVSCGHDVERELFSTIREGDLQHAMAILNNKPKLINGALSHNRRLSPLHYAASHGQSEVLLLLLEKGASLNAMNHHRQTPLMLACKNGRVSCIEQLVDWGADILVFDALNGRTCLHYAAKSGHLDCVQRVLDAAQLPAVAQTWGFARFVNVRDGSGATPLHLAARSSHSTVVRLLLSKGSLVCATTTRSGGSGCGFGSTPLHFAACGGSSECVKELLAWGADRMQRNSQGHTPFFIAMKYKNTACASLLNPCSAEPLVWPSPWKFMSDLDPEAKVLLEVALAQANDAWERRIFSARGGETAAADSLKETQGSVNEQGIDDEETELCCICFERACTIEVQDCGHQMCAGCTLALCCHNKPNPAMPNSPAPACPFCRRNIGQLKRAPPKDLEQSFEGEKDEDKDVELVTAANKCKKSAEGSSSNFMGLVGKGSFRLLSSARGSGRVVDVDSLKECSSEQDVCAP